ncbi:MAG: DNA polymerase III subunit delta, partial [Bacteroidales bacterium]|nr:DNA polymerase III subunit delta [Bacteroidales bacterium]
MVATFESVKKDIASKTLKPVYLLKGEESYYLEALSEEFENSILDEAEKDFNLSVFYGKDAQIDDIITSAKQYPMMASHRVVILKEAQTMDKRELAKIERYLLSPVSTTVLVFVNNDKDFPQALTTKFDKTGAVFDSKKLKEEKLVSWIDSYVKQQGYTIESQASVMVADYLGNNLMKISNEISKLLINLKQKNIITTEDVSSHIGISKDYNVFELQKAISRLDYNKINKCVDYMAANPKENPLQVIFANLFTYFTKVLIVSQLEHQPEPRRGQVPPHAADVLLA